MKKLDEWPRGLRQRFTKPPSLYRDREFESHLIRKGFREAKKFADESK